MILKLKTLGDNVATIEESISKMNNMLQQLSGIEAHYSSSRCSPHKLHPLHPQYSIWKLVGIIYKCNFGSISK